MTPPELRLKIMEVIKFGAFKDLFEILRRTDDIYEKDDLGWALIYASQRGLNDLIEKLINCGADPNYLPEKCLSLALHNAISGEHRDTVILLIRRGADVNCQDSEGDTALHTAIDDEADGAHQTRQKPEPNFSQLLLEFGANPLIKNNRGLTPIDFAKKYQYNSALLLLLDAKDKYSRFINEKNAITN